MQITSTLRRYLVSPYTPGSFGYKARAKRFELLLSRFPDFRDMHVLDMGGDVRDWKTRSINPRHVTILSIGEEMLTDPEPWMTPLKCDACDSDAIPSGFDLVYSNSLIEHLGGPYRRRQFVAGVYKAAPHFWVQTPYRYFPLESHLIFPGFQFLPLAIRGRIARLWPLAVPYDNPELEPVSYSLEHDLLTKTEMRTIFPDAEIIDERVVGLTKSLIATK